MNNTEYHAHPAISKSHLDQVAKSPLHYWARYLDPNRVVPEPTPAMAIGSAVHTHVLELDQWDARYVSAPDGIDRRTKAGKAEWEAFTAAATGRTVLPKADADLVMRMAQSVFSHPAAAMLLALPGKAETTHMWTDAATGLQCKCRPDWLTDDGRLLVDLKTTEDASRGALPSRSRNGATTSKPAGIWTALSKPPAHGLSNSCSCAWRRKPRMRWPFTPPMPR
jgi:hypothetical protein